MRKKIFVVWTFSFLFLIFAFAVGYGYGSTIETSVEDTLLKGDWKRVFELLEKDDTKASDPVARLIMGHACLVTNRNNASMLLFLSVKEEKELKLWSEWAESLLRRNPQNPVALYLSADASARQGRLEEAEEGLTQALKIKEDFALALNARGVVRVLTNDWDNALVDLLESTRLGPDLADAYANLGTYWILKEAAEGALEAFNQAIAINSEFALAYNGRGCAYFGRGRYEYEAAIDDMGKAFELCPAMLPALSNQGLVLAAIASQSTPQKADTTKPGTTFIAKSDLERMDYTSFTSLEQITQFYQSVEKLGEKDSLSAVRVYSVQLAKIGNYMNELSNKIQQRRTAIVAADKIEKDSQWLNQTLSVVDKLMDGGKNVRSFVPQPNEGWRKYYDLSRKIVPLSASPTIGIIKGGVDTMQKIAHLGGDIAEMHIGVYTSELAVRTRQYYDLQEKQGKFLAQAINQGADFSKADILGIGSMCMPTARRGPIPEYSIPHQSPLTQFNVLPGAIGKDIAPIGKTPLVVIDGKTDSYRLGTMLHGFEGRGVQTLPVPTNMDAQSFARMVGADRVVKITGEPGSAAWLPKTPVPNPKVGGVTQDMSGAHVDLGNWPVVTTFSLFYTMPGSSTGGSNEEMGKESK